MSASRAAPPPAAVALRFASLFKPAEWPAIWREIVKHRISYLLLLPFLFLFCAFVVLPVILSGYLSLTDYSAAKAPVYTGLDNFSKLLSLDVKVLPQATDKTTGELLFKCGTKQVPKSQVAELEASGTSCAVAMARPNTVLTKGYLELTRFSMFGTTIIIGATENRFWIALWNTLRYAIFVIPLGIIIGLALALALQRQSPLNYVLRTVFFLPSVTSTLAVITVWRYIFNSDSYGLVNGFFATLGISQQTFLADANWTMPVMIMFALWGGAGYTMILFLAGLQSISIDLYEVAAIDGASQRQRFFGITLPLLRPTLLYTLVTGTIGALQVFEIVYVLFSNTEKVGGVLDSGLTIVPYLYENGFRHFDLGFASSIAWILFIIIFILTLINLRVGRINDVD